MAHFRLSALVLLVSALFLPGQAAAQVSGRIAGTVLDPSGNVIVGARVSAENQRTNETQSVLTNETGSFAFLTLPPSVYSIRVQSEGFTTVERKDLVLNANQVLSLGSLQLQIGSTSETVTVVARGATVQTDTSGNTALLTDKQLGGLMSRGRDIVSLMTVLPGVSQNTSSDSVGGNWGTETPNMQGVRSHWNTFKLDGQPGNDIDAMSFFTISVSMDAIEEVSVKSNSYLAEDGRLPGVNVNIVSKSGTREFHGSGYWFKRHEQFNANDFFNNRLGIARPLTRYNTFGGTLGGPVYIPKVFNTKRDKLFFFVSREDWSIKLPAPLYQATVPTELERQGNFSQSLDQNGQLIPVVDPTTGQPFPNNMVPAARIHPMGRALLNVLPLPNQLDRRLTGGAFNYQFQEIRRQPKQQTQLKIDWLATANDRITFRPRWWRSDLQGQFQGVAMSGNIFLQPHHYEYPNRQYSVGYTKTISPTVVNEFDFGFGRTQELGTLTGEFNLANVRRENTGLSGLKQLFPSVNPLNLIPRMSFGGLPSAAFIDFDPRTPIDARDERYYFNNNLSWVKGGHTLKFGVYFERNHASEGPRAASAGRHMGQFDFGRDRNNPLDSNHPFSNAIIGNFRSYSEANGRTLGRAKTTTFEWFAQDSWKATRHLTLDYGVRFYWFTPWRLRDGEGAALALSRYNLSSAPRFYFPGFAANGKRAAVDPRSGQTFPEPYIGAFIPGSGDRLNGMVVGNAADYPDGYREVAPVQAAPRFGFAYDVGGKSKTVVRGGFSVTKQTISSSQQSMWTTTTSPPLIESPTIFYGDMNSFLQSSGVLFPAEAAAFETNFSPATVYHWSFGVQQDLGAGTVLDATYVGSTGRHLYQRRNLNTLAPGVRFQSSSQDPTTNRPLSDNFLRPYPGYTNVNYLENSGYSNYNGLQVGINRRYTAGLQFGVSYTWSKAMGITNQDGDFLPLYRDYRTYNYGKLGYDQTHILVFNYLWSIPNASALGRHSISRAIFHNWELAGITTFASGTPQGINFSRTDGIDRQGGGDAPRVYVLEKPVLDRSARTFDRWFNTNAFLPPERNQFGNAPRDVFRGPGIHNWDLTILKNFPVTEATRFQFRAEFYNVFNHTQYSAVDNSARFDAEGRQISARFGQVTATRLPRQVQFALRFEF